MKYRTKVIILLMAMVFLTTGISVGILYWNFERLLRDQMGSQILSAAATTAAARPTLPKHCRRETPVAACSAACINFSNTGHHFR